MVQYDGIYLVVVICGVCLGSDEVFVCNGLDFLFFLGNKIGDIIFDLFFLGVFVVVDWVISVDIEGVNVGNLIGVILVSVDVDFYLIF